MHAILSSADFFIFIFFSKSVKQFRSRSGPTFGLACAGLKIVYKCYQQQSRSAVAQW